MAINVTLYSFTKRENSTKQPTGSGTTYSCTMIDDTSLMNPVFKLSIAANPIGNNYCYVADFNRYYFIREINTYQNFWHISCECDVLASFKTEIGTGSHYVLRAASDYDGTISDTVYPATTHILENLIYPPVPTGKTSGDPMHWSNGHSYVLGIVGGIDATYQIGSLTYYWMGDAALYYFIKYLRDNIDSWSYLHGEYSPGVQKALIDPIQYIKSAICLPVAPPESSTNNKIIFGYYEWDIPSFYIVQPLGSTKTTTKEDVYIDVPTHPQASTRGSYLNCQPYSYYNLHYGPWGDIELDPLLVNGNTQIKVSTTYDMLTGIGRLLVQGKEYPHRTFFNGSAKVGVDINLSQIYKDALSYQAASSSGFFNAVTSGANVGMSLSPGEALANLSNGLNMATAAVQDMTRYNYPTVKGIGDGGAFLSFFDTYNLYLLGKFNYIVDENLAEIGRPLCQTKVINTLSGYILCQLADCQITGTQAEAQKINHYMNTGFYYE